MTNHIKTVLLTMLILLIVIIGFVITYYIYNFIKSHFTLTGFDASQGELLETLTSPDGRYELISYFINGGSLSGNSVLVQLKTEDKVKNIYLNYPKDTVKMTWLDENTVKLDDIVLDVRKDTYDWRYKK